MSTQITVRNNILLSAWNATFQLNYLIPSALVIFIFMGFDQQAYIGPKNIQGMILLLILYGWLLLLNPVFQRHIADHWSIYRKLIWVFCFYSLSAIPLMYPASLIFSVPSSAFVGLACGNLFIGVITTISSFVLQLFDDAVLFATIVIKWKRIYSNQFFVRLFAATEVDWKYT